MSDDMEPKHKYTLLKSLREKEKLKEEGFRKVIGIYLRTLRKRKKSKTKEIAKRESIAWSAWKMTGSFAP